MDQVFFLISFLLMMIIALFFALLSKSYALPKILRHTFCFNEDMCNFRYIYWFLGAVLLLSTYGCDEILECAIGINPEIHNNRLSRGLVGRAYFDEITAEVRNEVNDNDYIYNFDVIGELPPGIFIDFDRRSIELYGTPEEAGMYTFEVQLSVEYYDEFGYDGSPTCSDEVSREFTLRIEEST